MQKNLFLKPAALATTVIYAAMLATSQAQTTIAYDNADGYPGNPDHGWPGYNGGSGYNLWTALGSAGGGGTYMDGVGVSSRQTDGNYSFALYSGSGSYAISRPLASSLAVGQFSLDTRFDIAGNGPNLINLRAGNDTSSFGSGELLSFGIVNDSQLSYTDGSGFHTLSSGEARGSVWDWTVNFNAAAGTYSLSVAEAGGGYSITVSGNLESSATSVGSFGVINSSTGDRQNVIFDSPQFQVVPEPTTFALIGLGAGGLLLLRRRK